MPGVLALLLALSSNHYSTSSICYASDVGLVDVDPAAISTAAADAATETIEPSVKTAASVTTEPTMTETSTRTPTTDTINVPVTSVCFKKDGEEKTDNFVNALCYFTLRDKWLTSPDSYILRFDLPSDMTTLNLPAPSGVKLVLPETFNPFSNSSSSSSQSSLLSLLESSLSATSSSSDGNEEEEISLIEKSYSIISHENTEGYFDLLVKAYGHENMNKDDENNNNGVVAAPASGGGGGAGGGFGYFLCNLLPGQIAPMRIKKARKIHSMTNIQRRWDSLTMIAGGTGVAPFVQMIRSILADSHSAEKTIMNYDHWNNFTSFGMNENGIQQMDDNTNFIVRATETETETAARTRLRLISFNQREEDILMRDELDALARAYPNQLTVTHVLTQPASSYGSSSMDENDNKNNSNVIDDGEDGTYGLWKGLVGRGTVEMAKQLIPSPFVEEDDNHRNNADDDGESCQNKQGTEPQQGRRQEQGLNRQRTNSMIMICGKDGFVSTWAGPILRIKPDPNKGIYKKQKLQGPVGGILRQLGYDETQVYKF